MYTPDFMYNPNEEDYATISHKNFSPNIEKWEFVESMNKLQTGISDIKQLLGSIHANLKVLTVSVQNFRIAVKHLSEQNH